MRVFLVLCLLVSITSFDLLTTGICLFTHKKLRAIVKEAIDTIKEEDFGKLFSIVLSNIEEVKSIFQECKEDDISLQFICENYGECKKRCDEKYGGSKLCYAKCAQYACPDK